MSSQEGNGNAEGWGILSMLIAVVLAIVVVVAMFTAQPSTNPGAGKQRRGEEGAINRFQDNVEKSVDRALGDTL